MSCRPSLTLADFGVFDVAKIHIFLDIARKRNPCQHKPAGNGGEEMSVWLYLCFLNNISVRKLSMKAKPINGML